MLHPTTFLETDLGEEYRYDARNWKRFNYPYRYVRGSFPSSGEVNSVLFEHGIQNRTALSTDFMLRNVEVRSTGVPVPLFNLLYHEELPDHYLDDGRWQVFGRLYAVCTAERQENQHMLASGMEHISGEFDGCSGGGCGKLTWIRTSSSKDPCR